MTAKATAEDDNVRDLNSGPVDFDVDSRKESTYPPYRLKMDGRVWAVEQPDVGTVMQAEQSPTSEAFMEIMFEEQWEELGPIFKSYRDPKLMFEVARNISVHFDLDTAARPRNRRERRAQPRR